MGDRKYYAYLLVGFESFLDWNVVEFLERLPDGQVCNGCGAVPAKPAMLPCMHTSCLKCDEDSWKRKCMIHKQEFPTRELTGVNTAKSQLLMKNVRCLSASHGCTFTGPLGKLDEHFPRKCDFAGAVCSFCGTRIPFKGLEEHYAVCRATTDSSRVKLAKIKQLLEDLTNAKNELEEAVSQASSLKDPAKSSIGAVLVAVEKLRAEMSDDVA